MVGNSWWEHNQTLEPLEDKHRHNTASFFCSRLSGILASFHSYPLFLSSPVISLAINETHICPRTQHSMDLCLSKVQYPIIPYCMRLFVSIWVQQQMQDKNDAVISKWLVGLGAQPWQQRLLMYSHALTFQVHHLPVYLPHLDQPSESVFVCVFVWKYISVVVVFVCIWWCTYGYDIVQ